MSWGDTGFYTYLVLNPGVTAAEFENKLKLLVERDFGEVLRQYRLTLDLKLQPLTDIHLNSSFMQELEANGNRSTVTLLSIIAFFILVIAWVNYINITTARSLTRAMETGLSKAMGAARRELMNRFFVETILINIAALLASLLLITLAWPMFSHLTGIPEDYVPWSQGWFWLTGGLLFVSSILLSGTYPVFVQTSFSTSEVLRGRYIHSKSGILIRKILVAFQLVMAISLITCTIMVFQQVTFLRNQDKGINIRDVLAVRAPRVRDETFGSRLTAFREELLRDQIISRFSVGTEVPGRQILWDAGGIFRVGSDQSKNYQILGIDYDYIPLLEAEIVAGRNFDRTFSDSSSLLLNETAVRWMEFESPAAAVDQKVNYWDNIYTIAGVVKDYRQQSPKEAFEPTIYRFMPHGRDVRGFFLMKILPGNEARVLEMTEKTFSEFFPDNPFDYLFLEDYYDQQYRDEKLLGTVFGIFALLAIMVTCLGIFGLTTFLMLQKVREISIRRISGSGVASIIMLFSREFIRITGVSFIISVPLCYYWVTGWLRSFEIRMDLNLWNFMVPLLIVLAMTLITIGLIVYKTALSSPAEKLKSE
jgi:putative ABC transport system permease protein